MKKPPSLAVFKKFGLVSFAAAFTRAYRFSTAVGLEELK
jgi:hypothetical protein